MPGSSAGEPGERESRCFLTKAYFLSQIKGLLQGVSG